MNTNKNYLEWKKQSDPDKGFAVRGTLVEHAAKKGFNAIIDEYVYIYPENIERTFRLLPLAWESFKGVGVDLGGGVGCVAATIARKPEVEKIYCVEFTKEVVELCQSIVKQVVLPGKEDKVVSVLGDFDNLELADGSIDFAIDWDSLHHSYDVIKTLRECHRVLKPSGRLIMVDRVHNNNTPESELERRRTIVYDKEFLRRNYLDENIVLTRKDLGEHEWRFREWESFFSAAGFKVLDTIIIKTDTEDNRAIKNDKNLVEILTNYNLGGFGSRKVGYILEAL
ncbi:hypothetical protein BK004_01435 [bacterium CG10_46_32]|nr:MAG: hypothetical protein BK004_01435 [bacterium CG10_46_32]PIR56360.1 MAG: hypothetical protein COU73_01450 [Parcubacteria group bacterium CG10_big_fil_rev_8_21_14_0_10_46_32]